MIIEKVACDQRRYFRRMCYFTSAREATFAVLQHHMKGHSGQILLPAYIGWSSREGSGVFDPIRKLGLKYEFYAMDRELHIDVADLEAKLDRAKVLLIIHYFGWPDPRLAEVIAMARSKGVAVIEDAAHALFSSIIGGCCGSLGDATFYSLHKMLPLPSGGLLQINNPEWANDFPAAGSPAEYVDMPLQYNLCTVAQRRLNNAMTLAELVAPLAGKVTPLWPKTPPAGVFPQTFPVLVADNLRDHLNFGLNGVGFGSVSLYHQLIDEIGAADYPRSHWLADNILNLPVHQDCSPEELVLMVGQMQRLLGLG